MFRMRMLLSCALMAATLHVLIGGATAHAAADIDALNKQVFQLYHQRKYAQATVIARQALALASQSLGPEHPDTLRCLNSLAFIYDVQRHYREAEPLYKRALEGRTRVLGKEHPDTLTSASNLAELHQTLGRYGEAEPLLKSVLEARERVLGREHPDTLASLNNLAGLYQDRGRYGEAEPLYKRALAGRERILGKDHASTLNCVNNLAALYRAQGRYREAELFYKRALEARERVLGKDDPDTLASANNLAALYYSQGNYGDAEPLFRRAVAGREAALGKDHPETLASVNNLAVLYADQGRDREAEALSKRALDGRTRVLGEEHPDTLESVGNLAELYRAQNRYREAEALGKHALEAKERVLGKEHPATLVSVNNLAALYRDQGRYVEAEPLYKRALDAHRRVLGETHPNTLTMINNLAGLDRAQGRYREAEPRLKRVVDVREQVLGREHPDTLGSINDLALLYQDQGRYDEAELLSKRVLEDRGRVLGKEHARTLDSENNLAALYHALGRNDEAEPLYRHALEVRERILGKDHPDTLVGVGNLAALCWSQRRYEEAERLYKRAVEANKRILGEDHPNTLATLNSLAVLYHTQGRNGDAEPLMKRVLETRDRVLGEDHPSTLASVNNLAALHFEQGDWAHAVQFWRRSTTAIARRTRIGVLGASQAVTGKNKSEAEQLSWQFWGLVKATYRLMPEGAAPDLATSRDMFETAQWALASEAAQSLAQMAARSAKGDPALAKLVRERQDLLAQWRTLDVQRSAALGRPFAKRVPEAEAENAARVAAVNGRIAEIDRQFAGDFPDYAVFANPAPLSAGEVQAQLGADEALVLFLDTQQWQPTPDETFIWVVTKTDMRWVRSSMGKAAINREVQALRCGLDEEEWATPTKSRQCGDLLGLGEAPDRSRPLPFHLRKAHELYRALFGGIEDVIAGKRLLIVPSGALTILPLHVLVTKAPDVALPETFEGYRDAAWLGRRYPITTLPAVYSLKARQRADPLVAADDYAGYGDPLLRGDGANCRSAKTPDACPEVDAALREAAPAAVERATLRGYAGRRSANTSVDEVFAKGSTPEALLEQVRRLCPLPDTAYEIKCVAARFRGKAPLVRLEGEATEANLKALSESGGLARYKVLHFATHGLLSADVEQMAKRQGQPALVMTPPDRPAGPDDDGLLTASEIAGLKLNADWVVLSACNTAAGEHIGAQALSGLARAFFYAGGRALLVSHWPVYSDATVRLATGAFAELDSNPKAGRAKALQSAMIALVDDRSQADNAHPAVWAPFVMVGDGGR